MNTTLEQRRENFLKMHPEYLHYSNANVKKYNMQNLSIDEIEEVDKLIHKKEKDKEQQKIKREERKKEMFRLRIEERKTLTEIATRFNISKERVRQIIKGIPRPKIRFSFVCATCKKEKYYYAYQQKNTKYCNNECKYNRQLKYGIKPSDNRKEYSKRLSKARYADPIKRAKHNKIVRKYYTKIMADPIRREKRRLYQKELYYKLKNR